MYEAGRAQDEPLERRVARSEPKRGSDDDRVDAIAVRTVSQRCGEEGRTPPTRRKGTGNPDRRPESRMRATLRERARRFHLFGRSRLPDLEHVRAMRAS